MSIKSLPERADLEQLKKQARELLDAVHSGETSAIARVAAAENASAISDFALHDAQRVLAREYGFPSWAKLKLEVETRTIESAETRLFEAVLGGEEDVVRTLLIQRPALATRSPYMAAALGDVAAVNAELDRNPEFARSKGGSRDWEPLLYVGFAQIGSGDNERTIIAQ